MHPRMVKKKRTEKKKRAKKKRERRLCQVGPVWRVGYARCVAILYLVEIAVLSRLGERGLAITRAFSTAQVRGPT